MLGWSELSVYIVKWYSVVNMCTLTCGYWNINGHRSKYLGDKLRDKEFLDAMYTTVAILAVEMSASDESTIYLLDLIDGL